MGRFAYLIENQRLDRRARSTWYLASSLEWTAAPLGLLGRRLLTDIERYLEFFEIAGAELPHDRTRPAR